MATRRKRSSRRRQTAARRQRSGALGKLRGGFKRAALAEGPKVSMAWIFWGFLGIFIFLFAWSFVRP